RKGSVVDGNAVGDSSPEARDRQMTVEVNVASAEYGDICFNFLDCPGSVEFSQETFNALIGVDAAIVVCEPNSDRALTLAPLFQFLDNWEIPHILFLNKMERAEGDLKAILKTLQTVSTRPLVMHQYPIGQGDDMKGFIDLITEQAYQYHDGAAADPIPLPEELKAAEQAAREEMLETLADFDDHLLEELLEEIEPSQDEILTDFKMELGADLIVPVLIGRADKDYGVRPLLDTLLREAPDPNLTATNRGVMEDNDLPLGQVLKTYFTQQGGKLSLVRLWRGTLKDGDTVNGARIGGMYTLFGNQQKSLTVAQAGDIVALARLDAVQTGQTLSTQPEQVQTLPIIETLKPVYALAIAPENRSDEVKISGALSKLMEEDPSLSWEQHGDTHEVILWGQGEVHLRISLDKLRRKHHVAMSTHLPHVPYKETIAQPTSGVHGRYKRQSGGHGQFGDVYLDIRPLPRGTGFDFSETIVGGVVPKQYIPGVETGVREYLHHGPLGFPVVDVAVTLTDGSYHSVDSSEQAFKQAARIAMQEGMQQCKPRLLEPVLLVTISVPNEYTSNALRLISTRRGQILGYDIKPNWKGWDEVSAYMPQAETYDLIVELRSLTMGVGSFSWDYDHLQEVPDKIVETVLAQAKQVEA
ncbi:MAG: elongation factor G, partial [Cyanothece sp. SIO2G6]|nr:elongation factor G [Cyanothece sp. SIO2G6]